MASMKEKKKHTFFLPLMFIGMGLGFLLSEFYENAFVACMFIGMGLGLFLDSLFVIDKRRVEIKKAYKTSSFALMLLGIFFVLAGIIYLINPLLLRSLENYIVALGFIAFGLFIFLKGAERIK